VIAADSDNEGDDGWPNSPKVCNRVVRLMIMTATNPFYTSWIELSDPLSVRADSDGGYPYVFTVEMASVIS
jgi:hypothetical protein